MSIYYDLETDVRYKQGVDVGVEQGVAQGAAETKRALTIKHLRKHVFSIEDIADFVDMPIEYVLGIQAEIAGE
jgi:hypothetical protein